MAVYLIHFSRKLGHAQHYAGFADAKKRKMAPLDAINARLDEHQRGQGARICQVAVEQGIELILVKTWPKEGRKFERRLKKSGSLRPVCPLCREQRLIEKRTYNKTYKRSQKENS